MDKLTKQMQRRQDGKHQQLLYILLSIFQWRRFGKLVSLWSRKKRRTMRLRREDDDDDDDDEDEDDDKKWTIGIGLIHSDLFC